MSFDLKPVLTEWLKKIPYLKVAEVTDYKEEWKSGGYCETCYYSDQLVVITYTSTEGHELEYEWYGGLADLIRELTD